VLGAAQRAALHSAQHYTAPSTASQDKADRSKQTKPVAQRGFVVFFVRLAPMKTVVRTPELDPCA